MERMTGSDYVYGGKHNELYLPPREPYQENPLQVIRRRVSIIVLLAVLVAGLAGAFSLLQAPVYETSIKILIEQNQVKESDVPTTFSADIMGLQELTATMTEVAMTRLVAEGVVQKLDLPMSPEAVQGGLYAEQLGETQLIQISYSDTDPERTQRVANAVGDVISEKISAINGSGHTTVAATVLEPASLPTSPISPNPGRNILLGLVLGTMLGLGLAFLLDYLDDNWQSPEEVEQVSGVPTFGIIPSF